MLINMVNIYQISKSCAREAS